MKIKDIEISWLGHAAFKIKIKNKTIFIDPFQLKNSEKADLILITHSHYDHCSFPDIEKISKDGTKIICTADCQSKINKINKKIEIVLIEPNKEISLEDIKIKTIPAYNVNKQFHPKSEGWVGYILEIGKIVIYHAGDTDLIKEMSYLSSLNKTNYFIFLLPIGGTYTMNVQEALKAVEIVNPSLVIPMHYGSIIGTEEDAIKFVELCKEKKVEALILKKE